LRRVNGGLAIARVAHGASSCEARILLLKLSAPLHRDVN